MISLFYCTYYSLNAALWDLKDCGPYTQTISGWQTPRQPVMRQQLDKIMPKNNFLTLVLLDYD